MKYIDFKNQFSIPIFTSQDIRLLAIDITPAQLTQWQKKDYISKIRNGVYIFNDAKNKLTPEELSAALLEPSYISLESALFKYNLIPEVVVATTAVTNKKTCQHNTFLGHFTYQHLKSQLYFGYAQQVGELRPYLMAEPEKAILDFFYLHPNYSDLEDIKSLRLNPEIIQTLNQKKIKLYAQVFPKRVIQLAELIWSTNA